jgi:hypothetical protein
MKPETLALLGATELNTSYAATSDKSYNELQRYWNVTSYSMLDTLHQCPRKFQLIKARAAGGAGGANNVDFAFGHSVGAGVQAWLMSKDLDAAIFNGMMAWRLNFDASIEKKNKSIWNATLAIQKYASFHEETLEDWDVYVLPSGKPAIELSIEVIFENGFKHYMHIDSILQHRSTKQLAIQENKTTGFKNIEEAIYANSSQALSYAVLLDMLGLDTTYEVFYVVYSTPSREWQLLPFSKNTTLKAEWLQDVMLDHASIATYRKMNFYPKRGDACFAYMRRCEFFGTCNLVSNLSETATLAEEDSAEAHDFSFTLTDIISRQKAKILESDVPIQEGGNFSSID